ncbi:MAG: hypothetical protein ACPGVO_23215 [Spirulinaceae cyanobacterium]
MISVGLMVMAVGESDLVRSPPPIARELIPISPSCDRGICRRPSLLTTGQRPEGYTTG